MSQLRHHRQRNYGGGNSFVTSLDFSPNTVLNYESRKSGDKLSNILRVGIQSGQKSTSMANAKDHSFLNPPPSVP